MRDCVFLVADGQMQAVFTSFMSLDQRCAKLGTGPFHFDAERDLLLGGTDPIVYRQAHELLRGHLVTHRHAMIVLDYDFGHRWEPEAIVASIQNNMRQVGWTDERFEVVLIRPELEAWIWQDNPNVQEVFYRRLRKAERERLPTLRAWLRDEGLWPDGETKPPDPKAAVERARQAFRAGAPMVIYTEICRRVSLEGCQDASFRCLRNALRRWFPGPGQPS